MTSTPRIFKITFLAPVWDRHRWKHRKDKETREAENVRLERNKINKETAANNVKADMRGWNASTVRGLDAATAKRKAKPGLIMMRSTEHLRRFQQRCPHLVLKNPKIDEFGDYFEKVFLWCRNVRVDRIKVFQSGLEDQKSLKSCAIGLAPPTVGETETQKTPTTDSVCAVQSNSSNRGSRQFTLHCFSANARRKTMQTLWWAFQTRQPKQLSRKISYLPKLHEDGTFRMCLSKCAP